MKKLKIVVIGEIETLEAGETILRLSNYYDGKLLRILILDSKDFADIPPGLIGIVKVFDFRSCANGIIRATDFLIRLVNRDGDFIT